jgi:hypothetical protein
VVSKEYFVTMAHVDLGLIRVAYVNARNLKTGKVEEVQVQDFLKNKVSMNASKFCTELESSVQSEELTSSISFVKGEKQANI